MKSASQVLARKYRPKNFDELIGQESVSQTLSLALDANRLSHAYLFSGLRGSGKTSTARIFAKALICEKGISQHPCGICQNCEMAIENRHMDIVEMDGASSRKIDDIRDLIEQTKYKPSSARFKIFIIDEVHMLTKEAFNALLKTLEEPPSYVKFILATTDPLKLPATILSRTQHFRFKSIAQNKIVDHLARILNLEGIKYEHNALEILARSGSGSLRDTLTLLDQAIIYSKNHVDVQTVTDMLGLVDPKFIAEIFEAVFSKDRILVGTFVQELQEYEAQMVVDELIAYLKERMYERDPLFSTLILDRFFRILSDSKYLFSINAEGSFVLTLVFFKMIEALRIKEVDQMIESLQKEMQKPSAAVQKSSYTLDRQTASKEQEENKPNLQDNPQKHRFDELISKIKDRNLELGECFEKSIYFVSFEDDTLTWESCAENECKKRLTHGYSVIKQLVRETFGFETKIKNEQCSQESEEALKTADDKYTPSTSMIEDAELVINGSCATGCGTDIIPSKEIDADDIKEHPMVKSAVELFEAKKMTIQSKI